MSGTPRVVVTGAGGRIGRASRPFLCEAGHALRSTDLPGVALEALPGEDCLAGDLRDAGFVDALLQGAETVVHFAGAVGATKTFDETLEHNVRLVHALYEGARRQRVRRIVYASSNHAFGLHPPDALLRLDAPYRPDGFYGLSKVWGEELARMYWTKHGIETVALRIGTFLDCPPRSLRELSSWLGRDDLRQLITRAVGAPMTGFAPVWGISANTRAWYDLTEPNAIGYAPVQDAEAWAPALASAAPTTPADAVAERYQGGGFASADWTPEGRRPGKARS